MEMKNIIRMVRYCGLATHSDIKSLEAITRGRTEGHHLWARICDTNLEIAICVLLLENDTDGLFDVNKEAPRAGDTLLVMRHSPSPHVRVLLEEWCTFRIIPMNMRL